MIWVEERGGGLGQTVGRNWKMEKWSCHHIQVELIRSEISTLSQI